MDRSERLQALAMLEPFFPNNRTMAREYSQIWSLWRSEKNPNTGAASQSLLWNLYRHENDPGTKKTSLLFGLFQYQSTPKADPGASAMYLWEKRRRSAAAPES